jgi:hypothetical protein
MKSFLTLARERMSAEDHIKTILGAQAAIQEIVNTVSGTHGPIVQTLRSKPEYKDVCTSTVAAGATSSSGNKNQKKYEQAEYQTAVRNFVVELSSNKIIRENDIKIFHGVLDGLENMRKDAADVNDKKIYTSYLDFYDRIADTFQDSTIKEQLKRHVESARQTMTTVLKMTNRSYLPGGTSMIKIINKLNVDFRTTFAREPLSRNPGATPPAGKVGSSSSSAENPNAEGDATDAGEWILQQTQYNATKEAINNKPLFTGSIESGGPRAVTGSAPGNGQKPNGSVSVTSSSNRSSNTQNVQPTIDEIKTAVDAINKATTVDEIKTIVDTFNSKKLSLELKNRFTVPQAAGKKAADITISAINAATTADQINAAIAPYSSDTNTFKENQGSVSTALTAKLEALQSVDQALADKFKGYLQVKAKGNLPAANKLKTSNLNKWKRTIQNQTNLTIKPEEKDIWDRSIDEVIAQKKLNYKLKGGRRTRRNRKSKRRQTKRA